MKDTTREIEDMVRERLMAFSGAERMRIASDMFESARRMVLASLPADLSAAERRRLLFERVYGEAAPSWHEGDGAQDVGSSAVRSPQQEHRPRAS